MHKNQLSIRLNGKQVGILEQKQNGKIIFTYDTSATHAISINMPVREESYDSLQTEAYFGGLLPESETTRKIIGKRFNISHNNSFALLKAIGYDCAGAISCHEIDKPIEIHKTFLLDARIITEDELYQHLLELPKKPLFLGVDGLRLSLAGVQDKAAVCLVDNKIALAENGCPTTHILKPSSQYFEGLPENEYFCLKIAKLLGLPIPDIQLIRIKDISFLLIERYDRRIKNNCVERIHQEDFCQALSCLTSRKYQNEGGPSFKNCFDLLKNTEEPVKDRNLLASMLVFNYLICNLDAHAKNFSLLHYSQNNIQLAPFYDIVCTRAYPELSKKMAMKIGSKYEMEDLHPRHWEQLCQDIQYRYPVMKELIFNKAKLILELIEKEREILSDIKHITVIDTIIKVVKENIKRTLIRFH
jgi:serine/threonine-protein kinase HipA